MAVTEPGEEMRARGVNLVGLPVSDWKRAIRAKPVDQSATNPKCMTTGSIRKGRVAEDRVNGHRAPLF